MVYLTARFALLAAAASLAAVSSVDAAAISARHSSSVASKDDGAQKDGPMLPLPARVAKGKGVHKAKHDSKKGGKHDAKGGKEHEKDGKKAHEARLVLLDDALPIQVDVNLGKRTSDQAFFDSRRAPHSDDAHDKVVINGDDDHVHIHDNHRHHHDKVIVNGDDEHVHIHRRRHHHHHDDWYDNKVVVNGDHDHVNIHERRSSPRVLVHNKHGQSFIVSRTHRAIARRSSETMERRVDENAPAGTIALMLPNDAGLPKRLGSLYMTETEPFVLNASTTNATTAYMVPDNSMAASSDPNVKYVRVHYPVTDARELSVVSQCATYDSTPDELSPLTVAPCRNDTDSTNPRQSQTFIYYVDTNVIAPMSAASNSTSDKEDDTEDESDIVDGGVTEGATSVQEDEPAQDVALVFEPNVPQEDTQSAGDESATTTTVTETQTVTVTASSTPSAAADDEEDSASSMMTSNSVQSASDSAATSSSTHMNTLNVAVYGASSASSSSPSEPTADSASSTNAASTSVDAEAVASGIANPSSDSMTGSSDPSPTSASASSVASVASRAEMTAVDTAPYTWKFNREMRW